MRLRPGHCGVRSDFRTVKTTLHSRNGDPIEAKATIANCNVKVIMKLEDADETYNVMKVRAGEANQMVADRFEANGAMGGYNDGLSTRNEKVNRLNIDDLVDQDPGEGFVIFRNKIRPVKMFYADPVEVEEAELNKFVMVRPPSSKLLKEITGGHDKLSELFGLKDQSGKDDVKAITDIGIKTWLEDFDELVSRSNESWQEAGIASIGLVEVRAKNKDKEFLRKAKVDDEDADESLLKAKSVSREATGFVADKQVKAQQEIEELNVADFDDFDSELPSDFLTLDLSQEDEDQGKYPVAHPVDDNVTDTEEINEGSINLEILNSEPENSVSDEAMALSETLQGIFEDSAIKVNTVLGHESMSPKEKNDLLPMSQINAGAHAFGQDKGKADEEASSLMNKLMSKISKYPSHIVDPKLDRDQVSSHIISLLEKIDKK